MNKEHNNEILEQKNLDILKQIKYYFFFWPYFLLSIVIFISAAFIYLRYTQPIFNTSATIQIKDESSDPTNFITSRTSSMINLNRVKIDNYIARINANKNLDLVIKNLDLQTMVFSVGRVSQSILFGDEIPFEIIFKSQQIFDEIILIIGFDESSLEFNGKKIFFDSSIPYESEDFILKINQNNIIGNNKFLIRRNQKSSTFETLSKLIKITANSRTGDNIEISINGTNKNRNETIINTLIEESHKEQIESKRKIYALSIDFINNRLLSIKNEIDSLSFQTTGFKSDNLIFSADTQTVTALTNISTIEKERFDLKTQKALAESLRENLENQENFSLLPSNIGITSANVNELVISYNELVLKRQNLLAGATIQNPLIIQISKQLNDIKKNIIRSVNNYLYSIQTSLSKADDFKNRTKNEVSKIPGLEATLLNYERRFQTAEKLFMFLLERKEDASISYESTLPDTFVINYAKTAMIPFAPKKRRIVLGAFSLAIFIPFSILYILQLLDLKIHTREQLQNLLSNLDILGEIPFVKEINDIDKLRSVFAESSRIIRSNISFKLPQKKNCYVILSSSSIKGEGKTFTAYNIAASYVAAGKKVLILGCDLRNPQLHNLAKINRKSNSKGLSNLLSNSSNEFSSDYITRISIFEKNMDLLLSGPIPPNPAELLSGDLFSKLLESLKKKYDYIIIDSAPLLLVSDTIPLLKQADLVLYTVRAQYTRKTLANYIKSLVSEQKVNNMGIVFNGIKAAPNSSYYKYGYSYRYSYLYKYNYGYGYGYGDKIGKG